MIFGIIIDTFGELRGLQASKLHNMRNTCFICGIDRFAFETRGAADSGFERHIKDDHNMWNYLGLMVHVREKQPKLYNGWEQHVGRKMAKNDASFLPRNTAIVLQASEEREGAALQQLDGRVSELVKVVETLATEQRALSSRLSPANDPQQVVTKWKTLAEGGARERP